jgi:hypothetical protein
MTTTREYLESIQVAIVELLAMDDDAIESAGISDVVIEVDKTMWALRDESGYAHCNDPRTEEHNNDDREEWANEFDAEVGP